MNCKICSSTSKVTFSSVLLNKYKVNYFCCDKCGFVQSDEPYWLDEAYSEAITGFDIGYANRNVAASYFTQGVISLFLNPSAKFIDYGGGYGLFVRFMRDAGFDFLRQDIHCKNIFSSYFDVSDYDYNSFELLTAFEVFEHLVDPVSEMEKMLKYSSNILFSTKLYPITPEKISEWWYLAPRFGQHISIYSEESLRQLANKFGLNYYTDGKDLHFFTKNRIDNFKFKLIASHKLSKIAYFFKTFQRPSLLDSDFQYLQNKFSNNS